MKNLPVNIPQDVLKRLMELSERTGKSVDELANELIKMQNDEQMPLIEQANNKWNDIKNDLFR